MRSLRPLRTYGRSWRALVCVMVTLQAACAGPAGPSDGRRSEVSSAPAARGNGPATAQQTTQFVPLDAPSFIPAAKAQLSGDEVVVALSFQGQYRAYPTRMLWFHHVVNDFIAPPTNAWRTPVLITY